MPIEFRCPGCSKLLRTPDESAGKKAKCPQCGTIADVPSQSAPVKDETLDPLGESPLGPPPDDPLAMPPTTGGYVPPPGPLNPYASPAPAKEPVAADYKDGTLVHSRVNQDAAISSSWEFFKEHMGNLAIFGVIVFAVNMALQIVGQVGGMASQATGEPAVIIIFQFFSMIISFLLQTWIGLGTVLYMLKILRTRESDLNQLMAAGPFFLQGLALNLIIGLIIGGIMIVSLIPGAATIPLEELAITAPVMIVGGLIGLVFVVIVGLRYTLAMFFLVDRKEPVLTAMSSSAEYMKGNKGVVFLTFFIVGIVGGLFICVTCTFGQILYIPYWGILTTMVYLFATGQPVPRKPAA